MAAWLPPGSGRDLHWWTSRELRSLAQALRQSTRDWLNAWGAGVDPAAQCRPAAGGDLAAQPTHAFVSQGGAQAWLFPSGDESPLARLLFPGATQLGPMARLVVQRFRADGLLRLGKVLGLDCVESRGDVPGPATCAPWSGTAIAEWGEPLHWRVLVGAPAAAPWRRRAVGCAPPPEPLAAVTDALARWPVPLQVELQGCELELGALCELQPGDVVRLSHSLETPASLREGKRTLLSARLGRQGGAKAVELAPA